MAQDAGSEPTGPIEGGSPREQQLVRENEALRARVMVLEARLSAMQVDSAGAAGAALASSGSATGSSASTPGVMASVTPPVTPSVAPPVVPPVVPPPPTTTRVPGTAARDASLAGRGAWTTEQFIGRRVVPFVGAIAVLGAIAFLVHYAYEIGLIGRIPPMGRFAVGVVLGVALLAAGEWVRRRGAPGAATGLDAAGVGSVMVSVALGVFSLRVFGPAAGAMIAAAAGVLGAVWSVRSGSVTVGLVALIGFLALPPAVGLYLEEPRLGGVLLGLALMTGLAMHAIGGRRFTAVRYFALFATVVLGAVVLGATRSPLEAFGFAIVWWGIVVGEAALAALRGASPRGNVVMVALASSALVLVEVGSWTTAAGAVTAIELLPAGAGALLLALAALLHGFVEREVAPGEAPESSDGGEAREVRAVSDACAALAQAALAFGVALALGGLAFIVSDGAKGLAVVAAAVVCGALSARAARAAPRSAGGGIVFGVVAAVLAWIGAVTAAVVALKAPAVPAFASLPMPGGGGGQGAAAATVEFFWRDGMAGLVLSACVLLAIVARVGARTARYGAIVPALVAWCVAVALLVPSQEACVLVALPAFAAAWWRGADLLVVVASMLLGAIASLVWAAGLAGAMGDGPLATPMRSAILLPPCAVAALLIAAHPALGAARGLTLRIAVCAVGAACAAVGLAFGERAGHRGIEVVLGASTVLAVAGVLATQFGRWRRSEPVVDGGMIMSAASVAMAAMLGFAWMFEGRAWRAAGALADGLARGPESVAGDAGEGGVGRFAVLATLVATALSAASAWMVGRALGEPLARCARMVLFVCAAAAGPLGALLVGALAGRPISPVLAVGGLAAVGVVELLIGFRRGLAPLRWAGLWTFFQLVARLFVVDLADAPVLVRVGLLFASGMVLVGAGIMYARSALPSALARPTGGRAPDGRNAE